MYTLCHKLRNLPTCCGWHADVPGRHVRGFVHAVYYVIRYRNNTRDLVADRCNFSTAARGNRSCDEDGKRPDSSLWYRFTLARLLKMSSADNLLHPSGKCRIPYFHRSTRLLQTDTGGTAGSDEAAAIFTRTMFPNSDWGKIRMGLIGSGVYVEQRRI